MKTYIKVILLSACISLGVTIALPIILQSLFMLFNTLFDEGSSSIMTLCFIGVFIGAYLFLLSKEVDKDKE